MTAPLRTVAQSGSFTAGGATSTAFVSNIGNLIVGPSSAGVKFQVTASGMITTGSGVIAAPEVVITSGTGSIGAVGTPVQTNALKLTLLALSGSAVVNNASAVTLMPSSASLSTGTLQVSAQGNLTVATGATKAATTNLLTNAGSNGNIILLGNLGLAGVGTSTSVNADGSGSISGVGLVSGASVALISGTGNIGISDAAAVKTVTANLTANTSGLGKVFVSNAGTLTIGTSHAGGTFQVKTNGSLTVGDVVTEGGSINLVASTGSLTLQAGKHLTAVEGNVSLQVTSTTGSSILLDTGSGITAARSTNNTALGNVTIFTGASATKTRGNPGTVTEVVNAPNLIFYGTGITATGANTIDVNGGSVVFSRASNTNSITIKDVIIEAGEGYVPISYITPSAPDQADFDSLDIAPSDISDCALGSDDVSIKREKDGTISLLHGDLFFTPSQEISMLTPHAKITAAPNSMVFATTNGSTTAVYNLHDNRGAAVSVTIAGSIYSVSPGQVLILSNSKKLEFAKLASVRSVGHRLIQHHDSSDGSHIFTAEFSAASALANVPQLRRLIQSNGPREVQCAKQLMKTAAILSTVGQSHGAYTPLAQ
jgi:hypothetical protein